jgi:hypothetical protein
LSAQGNVHEHYYGFQILKKKKNSISTNHNLLNHSILWMFWFVLNEVIFGKKEREKLCLFYEEN